MSARVSGCIWKNSPSAIASGHELGLVFANELLNPVVRDHDLDRRDAAAVDARQQPLGHDALEDAREDRADLRVLDRREELDQPADRLGCVDRVHRRQHEVARLGRLKGRLRRLAVAKLADQDDVRVLPQRPAKRLVERVRVDADLTLVDDARLVPMEDLDGILDRDDVLASRSVDVTDDRGKRRRLARPGGAGDENEAAVLACELLDAGGQAQAGEVGNGARNDAEGERDVAALTKGVQTKARQTGHVVGGVELAGALEELEPRRRGGADFLDEALEIHRVEDAETREGLEFAVETNDGLVAHLEVDVTRASLDRDTKDLLEVDLPEVNGLRALAMKLGHGSTTSEIQRGEQVAATATARSGRRCRTTRTRSQGIAARRTGRSRHCRRR